MAENMSPVAEQTPVQPQAAPPQPPKKKKKKKAGKIIKRVIALVIVAAIIVAAVIGLRKLFAPEDEGEVLTGTISYGSITSTVEGSGVTRAKNSASITLTTAGTVAEVYVSEGDFVYEGDPLYRIDSNAAQEAVEKAQKDVDSYQKELNNLYKQTANLNVTAPFSGKLMEVGTFHLDDQVSSGTVIAKLVDDSKMRLVQYYSYAYADQIQAGQTAQVSIPSSMTTVTGTVESVYLVNRISAEGSQLFEVDLVVDNPGTLSAGVLASATLTVGNGEAAYPYEAAELDYYQSVDVTTKVGGPVEFVDLRDYTQVQAGQTLMRLGAEDNDSAIFNMEAQLKTAQETLKTAQEALDLLNATAPIDGTVLSLSIAPGDEVAVGANVISIADTSTMLIDANIDERNISYVKAGMMVDLDQWGTYYSGVVESVSMTGTVENGAATFPAVISVDNYDGTMMPGSYVTYSFVASQSDGCLVAPIQAVKNVPIGDELASVIFVQSDTRPDNAVDLDVPLDDVPEGYYAIPVTTGISDTYNVEILEGAEPDMTVFLQVMRQNSWY